MSYLRDVLKFSGDINAIDFNSVIYHKERLLLLLKRVKTVMDRVEKRIDYSSSKDTAISQSLMLLSITLEEILEYVVIFSKYDKHLASHVVKHGSDEEQFIKWNERLQHCAAELQLEIDLLEVFNEMSDFKAFQKDLARLREKDEMLKMIQLLHGANNDNLVKSIDNLLAHQTHVRSTYQTVNAPDASLEINPKKIEYGQVIGQGGFGVVWKGKYKSQPVAIKTLPEISLTLHAIAALKAEANIMRRLAHPRIVGCFGVFESKGNHCMVMELMEGGSLQGYIKEKPRPNDWRSRYTIALDICDGVGYLHKLNVIHRDLKPGNVVLDRYGRAKVTDFGLSVIKNTAATSIKGREMGTVQYMAPECFGLAPIFSPKSDVYAFSIILWELAHWELSYPEVSPPEIKDSIRNGDRLQIIPDLPALVSEIITKCWDGDPLVRPDFLTLSKAIDAENMALRLEFSGETSSTEVLTGNNGKKMPRMKVTWVKYFQSRQNRKIIIFACIFVFLLFSGILAGVLMFTLSNKSTLNSVNCNSGLYFDGSICTQCQGGYFSRPNSLNCTKCLEGTYSNPGSSRCTACAAGLYSSAGSFNCTSCPAGTFSEEQSFGCVQCSAGYFSTIGSADCTLCSAGTFSTDGSSSCRECLGGSYSDIGSNNCTTCLAGYFSPSGASQCTACSAGFYSSAGSSNCTSCPAGTYSTPGSSSCSQCSAGYYSSGGASSCAICPGGSFSLEGFSNCSECLGGFYSEEGSSNCTSCLAGTYSGGGSPKCMQCEGGYFSNSTSSLCTSCPAGTYSTPGSSSCSQCSAGYYSGGGASSCAICPGGSFSLEGFSNCSECLGGFYSKEGSSNCTSCLAGSFSSARSSICSPCAAGYYSSEGTAICSPCAAGTYSAENSSTCNLCSTGYYSNPGSSICNLCDVGYYKVFYGECRPPGYVSTIAGSPGVAGSADGQGLSASFFFPFGITIDSFGNLYISDLFNNRIRRINSTGYVSTIAGTGEKRFADGQGLSSSFYGPHGIAIDSFGNLYIADRDNHRIRKINSTGYVSTIAGSGEEESADGQGLSSSFRFPSGIAVDSLGNLYIADTNNDLIRKINSTGYVSTISGSGEEGSADGQGLSATFNFPIGITLDSFGNLYIVENGNHKIRKINSTGYVSTIAGSGEVGSADGQGLSASFNFPLGIAIDSFGNLYIADRYNHRIRKINSTGYVSTFAGLSRGFSDGQGPEAEFTFPSRLALDPSGLLYVTEAIGGPESSQSHRVREVVVGTEP